MGDEERNLIYSVHNKLRAIKQQTKDDETEWKRAWEEHTSDKRSLQEYAKAMHDLATKVWDPRNKNMTPRMKECVTLDSVLETLIMKEGAERKKLKCRLEWVVHRCVEYFYGHSDPIDSGNSGARALKEGAKLKLLDVGSCYNPFSEFSSIFDITPVDLCPAPGYEDQIFQCDFTEVEVLDVDESECPPGSSMSSLKFAESESFKKLISLQRNSFDSVVFSYFLEYLADMRQRLLCCRKAFDLLKPNGLLFILRPDSNRVTPGGNNRIIKMLKIGMAIAGFKRIYLEKLEHLWCMGFKKLDESEKCLYVESRYFQKDVQKVNCEFALKDSSRLHELFVISQDLREVESEPANLSKVAVECDQELMKELPEFDSNMFNG